jgi:hypothetical protein
MLYKIGSFSVGLKRLFYTMVLSGQNLLLYTKKKLLCSWLKGGQSEKEGQYVVTSELNTDSTVLVPFN